MKGFLLNGNVAHLELAVLWYKDEDVIVTG
jgi:hypothetical protein